MYLKRANCLSRFLFSTQQQGAQSVPGICWITKVTRPQPSLIQSTEDTPVLCSHLPPNLRLCKLCCPTWPTWARWSRATKTSESSWRTQPSREHSRRKCSTPSPRTTTAKSPTTSSTPSSSPADFLTCPRSSRLTSSTARSWTRRRTSRWSPPKSWPPRKESRWSRPTRAATPMSSSESPTKWTTPSWAVSRFTLVPHSWIVPWDQESPNWNTNWPRSDLTSNLRSSISHIIEYKVSHFVRLMSVHRPRKSMGSEHHTFWLRPVSLLWFGKMALKLSLRIVFNRWCLII